MKKFWLGLLTFISFSTVVSAAEMDLQVTEERVKAGETVTVLIDTDVTKFDLVYDQNIFEEIDIASFDTNNSVVRDGKSFYLTEDGQIRIDLKAKEDIVQRKTTIKVNYAEESAEAEVIVGSKRVSTLGVVLIILAIGIATCGIIYYVKKKEDFQKEQIIVLGIASLLTIGFAILGGLNLFKKASAEGEKLEYPIYLTEDSQDKEDNEEKEPVKNKPNNNNSDKEDEEIVDGPIADNEMPGTAEPEPESKPEPKPEIKYTVEVTDFKAEPEVVTKDGDIFITFKASVNPAMNIKSVVINNKSYEVKKVNDFYQVVVTASNKYGYENYQLMQVELSNGTKVAVTEKTIKVYVLKEKPEIANIAVNGREEIPVLTFDVIDADQSFISGKVVMTEKVEPFMLANLIPSRRDYNMLALNDDIIFETTEVKVGHNEYPVSELHEGMEYEVVISLNYKTNEEATTSEYTFDTEEEKSETFNREYNFDLVEAKINSPVTKDEELHLSFKNGLFSYTDIEKITIDGETYELTKDAETGVYTVNGPITKCDSKGACRLHITSVFVTTESGTAKEIPYEKEIPYIYLKDEPTINSFAAQLNDNTLTGTYDITDADDTITSGFLIFEGPSKVTVDLTKEDLASTTFSKTVALPKAGDYQVTLVVNYDLGDGNEKNISAESASEVHQKIVATIAAVKTPDVKVERAKNADIYLTITSNTEEELKSITIAGETYDVTKQNNGTYKANVLVPEAGTGLTRTIEISKLTYATEEIDLTEPTEVTFEILKTKPSISSFTLSAAGGEISGSFELNDSEGAAVGAQYTINGVTKKLSDADFAAKHFTDETIRKAGNYQVTLTIIYDLGNGERLTDVTREESVTVAVDAIIQESSINPLYVAKDENVVITYTVIDNTENTTLSTIKVNGTDYSAASLGDHKYSVTIPAGTQAGEIEFKATELKYQDNEAFTLKEPNTITATVLKSAPTIGDTLTASYSLDGKTLSGELDVRETAGEETIQKGILTITGPCFTEAQTFEITKDALLSGTFSQEIDLTKMGTYDVSLTVVYNLGEKDIEAPIKEATVEVPLKISKITIEAPETVKKNETITLTYKVEDNTDTPIDKITVGGETKDVTLNDEGNYQVVLDGKDTAGFVTYKTTELYYDGIEAAQSIDSSLAQEVKVYVLKTEPTFMDPAYSETEADVRIIDSDSTQTSAQIIFTPDMGGDAKTYSLEDGKANISELANGYYDVEVQVAYDLADDSIASAKGTITKEYSNVLIITKYNTDITNLKVSEVTTNKVRLTFALEETPFAKIDGFKVVDKEGTEYSVTMIDDHTIEIDKPSERKELTISEISFDTEVKKSVSTDYVLVNKTKPEVTLATSVVNKNQVKATINTTDADAAIDMINYYAVLRNLDSDSDTLVEKQPINTLGEKEITFAAHMDGATRYQVSIEANYDLVDGKTYNNVVLKKSNYIVIDAVITYKATSANDYIKPAFKSMTVNFDFESNVKLAGIIDTIKIQTTEYEGEGYDKVNGLNNPGEDYKLSCGASTKEGDLYQTNCRIEYKLPGKSSVIKIKPLSFTTVLDEKVNNIDGASEETIDILKWNPKINTSTKNIYTENKVELEFWFDDVSMLVPIKEEEETGEKVYVTFQYGTRPVVEFKTSEELKDGQHYTVTFENVPNTPNIRIVGTVKYDMYHHVISKDTETAQEDKVLSMIHFFHPQDEITLNNINVVDDHGSSVGEAIEVGEQVKLAFGFDQEIAFKPTSAMISIDDKNPTSYVVEATEDGYVTQDYLKDLTECSHTIKITRLYGTDMGYKHYDVEKNNSIEIMVNPQTIALAINNNPLNWSYYPLKDPFKDVTFADNILN